MKRILSAILTALLLISTASCGSSGVGYDTTAPEVVSDSVTEPKDKFDDGLPDKKFGGKTITFGVSIDSREDIIAEEENGDVVNDAIFSRNRSVEERFDVKIESCLISERAEDWYEKLTASVFAGDNICDIAGHYAYMAYRAIQKGIYQDWNTIPYVDQSRPWWSHDINESSTINGKLFAITGYLGMSLMDYTTAIFFNQRYLSEYGYQPSDLYKMVYDGTWTFDKFAEIVRTMYKDLNGNNERDDDDFYGFATNSSNMFDIWQAAFDIPVSRKTKDGQIEIDVMNEKRLAALDKMISFFYANDGVRYIVKPSYTTSWDWYEQFNFASGRQTFTPSIFLAANELYRDMKDASGILPFPKWDEAQEGYHANICDMYAIWGIPATAADTELVGIVSEALACETLKTVYPAYYDVALKNKFSSDEDTANMVDIIASGMQFDMSYIFGQYLQKAPYLFRIKIKEGKNDLASSYAEVAPMIKENIKEIYKMYE